MYITHYIRGGQRLQAHGIHPRVERLIYLTEEEFKFLKRLKVRFCKRASRFFPRPQKVKKEVSEKAIEGRSLTRGNNIKSTKGFIYQKEAMCWRWQRVKEYYEELTAAERYEELAEKIKT